MNPCARIDTFLNVKRFWSHLETDFLNLYDFFHDKLHQVFGSSFIALIQKTIDASAITDFRPINLVGVISKTVSKGLATRLKAVLNLVISNTQSVFLGGRPILDGPSVVNEIDHHLVEKEDKETIIA